LSFDLIQKDENATYILGLFSALNPDKILTEFLIRGLKALTNDSGNIVTDEHDLSVALLTLEKYSLIKWDRQTQSLSIHRLIQTVIRDKMSKDQLTSDGRGRAGRARNSLGPIGLRAGRAAGLKSSGGRG